MAPKSGGSSGGRAATLGDLIFYLRGEDVDLGKGVDASKKKIGGLVKSAGKAAKTIGKAFTVAGAIITGIFALSLRSAMSFQDGLKKVETLGVENIKALSDGLKKFAVESGQDAIDMTTDLYNVLSAGIPEDAAIMVLEKAYIGAAAGAGSLSSALDAGTSLMNAYGLNTGTTEEIVGKFEETMGLLAVAVKEGKTTIDDLGAAVGKAAAFMEAAGVSMKEYLAMIAALTTTGVKAREAVTGIKAAIQAIVIPTEQGQQAANLLGLEFNTLSIKAEGAVKFLQKVADRVRDMNPVLVENLKQIKANAVGYEEERIALVAKVNTLMEVEKRNSAQGESLKKLRKELRLNSEAAKKNNAQLANLKVIGDDAEGTLGKLFGSIEGLNAVLGITGPLAGKVQQALGGMKDAVGTLHEMAEKYTKGNLTKAFNEQKASIKVLSIELGEVLLPIFAEVLAAIKPILNSIFAWSQANPKLFATLVKVTGAIGLMMVTIGPLLIALPSIGGFVATISAGLPVMIAGIGTAAVAIGAFALQATAVIAVGTAFFYVGKSIKWVIEHIAPLDWALNKTFDILVSVVNKLMEFLGLKEKAASGPGANFEAEREKYLAEYRAKIASGEIQVPGGGRAMNASAAASSISNNVSNVGPSVNINMGGVTLGSGMDVNTISQQIGAAVQRSLRHRGMSMGTL